MMGDGRTFPSVCFQVYVSKCMTYPASFLLMWAGRASSNHSMASRSQCRRPYDSMVRPELESRPAAILFQSQRVRSESLFRELKFVIFKFAIKKPAGRAYRLAGEGDNRYPLHTRPAWVSLRRSSGWGHWLRREFLLPSRRSQWCRGLE